MPHCLARMLVAGTFSARSAIRVLAVYWFLGRGSLPDVPAAWWFALAGVWGTVNLANAYTTFQGSFGLFGQTETEPSGRRLRLAEAAYALMTAGVLCILLVTSSTQESPAEIAALTPLILPEIMLLGRAGSGRAVHLPFLPLLRVAAAEGTRVEVDEAPGNGWTCVSKFFARRRLPIYLMGAGESFPRPPKRNRSQRLPRTEGTTNRPRIERV
ncbi:hypothetical protein [Alienimonas chondri]|uniref:Uncharacterized protein n=1 Tax=Alienimonas chondri TaxID=2681879 RepID=A0ABX1VHC9_9PLAN|nr:hypothetical protein [Alienimonas chondri]NNJ27285.1 hypothetical protein [Alienimonas chondri]